MSYRNPVPTVDIIIELRDRAHRPIILIERKNPPWVGLYQAVLLTMENQ